MSLFKFEKVFSFVSTISFLGGALFFATPLKAGIDCNNNMGGGVGFSVTDEAGNYANILHEGERYTAHYNYFSFCPHTGSGTLWVGHLNATQVLTEQIENLVVGVEEINPSFSIDFVANYNMTLPDSNNPDIRRLWLRGAFYNGMGGSFSTGTGKAFVPATEESAPSLQR